MINEKTREYYSLTKKNEVRDAAKKLRRQFLRYKDAEIVYSMSHKMLLEHASKAGAIYRMEAIWYCLPCIAGTLLPAVPYLADRADNGSRRPGLRYFAERTA